MNAQVQILDQYGQPIRAMQDTAHFAASRMARELRGWEPGLPSADAELLGENAMIAARSYDLERNHGVAAGAIRTNIDNIVGTGLRLAAKPDYHVLGRDKEWADEWSRTVEAEWRTFSKSLNFDAAEQLTFGGMTVMAFRTAMLSGDAIGLPLWLPNRPGARWSTALQAVDPARLGNPADRMSDASLRDGVEIGEYGQPVAYHIRKSHPGDSYAGLYGDQGWERIPAKTEFGRRRVIHLYEKLRPGQSRGKAILSNVMSAFKMLDHYQRIELQTAVVNSMIAAFVETPLKGDEIAELFGGQEQFMQSRNGWDVKLEGAGIIPLHPGDKLNAFTPTRPNSAYSAFVEAILRYIGTGLNMPYELLMKDFSKTNYSSARAALLEAWRYFLAMREWLSTYWANPIYELFLEEAVQRGRVEAPDFYENREAYCACKWIGPGRGWVDPVKEANASKIRVEAGLSTLERETAEQGLDWEEVLEQQARENARRQELGLVVQNPPEGATDPATDPDNETTDERPPRRQGQEEPA